MSKKILCKTGNKRYGMLAGMILLLMYMLSGCASHEKVYDNDEVIANNIQLSSAVNFIGYRTDEALDHGISIGKFSGVRELERFRIGEEGGTLSFACEIEVEEGRFKVVLVDADNKEILEILQEGAGETELVDYALEEGTYAIKAVGAGAKIEASYAFEVSGPGAP